MTGLNATFAGTIVALGDGSGKIGARVDVISLVGTSTTLAVGSVVPVGGAGAGGLVKEGERVVGFSVNECAQPGKDCAPPTLVETTGITQISAPDSTFQCSGVTVSAHAEAIAGTMASTGCLNEVDRLLSEAGASLDCHDTDACSARPGPASSAGWVALLGIAALIGRLWARR
jgi:hypothetical protein